MILLDLGLPDIDGIDVCRQLRRASSNPIIVLTADGAEDRKIDALDMGADDYVTKPFSLPELLARVRVALRHRQAARGLPGTDGAIEVGALSIDLDAHLAHVQGQELRLTRKEFALARAPGRQRRPGAHPPGHPRPGVGPGPDAGHAAHPRHAAPAQDR